LLQLLDHLPAVAHGGKHGTDGRVGAVVSRMEPTA
jgi:hypothetical protein